VPHGRNLRNEATAYFEHSARAGEQFACPRPTSIREHNPRERTDPDQDQEGEGKIIQRFERRKRVRELELEVVNTGDKPIYLIYMELITDVKLGNVPLVFSLVYGRAELGDIITKAELVDVPIKPGETYVFKIHPGQVPAWEQSLREKSHPDALRIKAKLELLSFGDGTGYFGNHPYPPADKPRSALDATLDFPLPPAYRHGV
jgi:hypothetical protein